MAQLERFGQVLVGRDAVLCRPFGIAAHEDEGDAELARLRPELEAGFARYPRIGDDELDGLAAQDPPGDRHASCLADAKISGRGRALADLEDHRIAVHAQYMPHRHCTVTPL